MKLVNLNGPQDVMALVVRRRWWILLPFLALSAGVILITAMLPGMYVSQSLVVIRPRDVSDDFVKDLIAGSTGERLSIITELVLSGSNLERVLKEFASELPEFQHLNLQQQIAKLRNQVHLEFSAGEQLKKGQLPVSAFRISAQSQDPAMARNIAQRLTEVFMEEDRKNRQANVNDTAEFLQSTVDELEAQLDASNLKLKELRTRRRNELPAQLETNLRRIENLSSDNQALRRDRNNLLLRQSELEQQMAATPERIPKPAVPVSAKFEDPEVEELRKMLAKLRDLKFTRGLGDKHPDVEKLNLAMDRFEVSMTPEQIALAYKEDNPQAPEHPTSIPATDDDGMQNNPAYLKLESTLEGLKRQIEMIDEQTARNVKTINTYNQHVSNVPQGEQELTDVLRENNSLSREHQELRSKLDAARLSEKAENQQKGTQFQIVDNANLPLAPTKPKKSAIMGAGLIASLLVSLAIAFVFDIANQKTWTQSDITSMLGLKVLVEVPRIVTRDGGAKARRKKTGFAASVGVAAVAYAMFLYLAYDNPGFVLQRLDPIIQKLY